MSLRFLKYFSLVVFTACWGVSRGAVVDFQQEQRQEIIVKLSGRGTPLDKARALKNANVQKSLLTGMARQNLAGGDAGNVLRIDLAPGVTVAEELARLAQNPAVDFVEPNYPLELFIQQEPVIPNDFDFSHMYALRNTGQNGGRTNAHISATEAWAHHTGSRDVLVAVIDTGIDYFHEDLRPNLWRNGRETPANGIDDDGNGYVDDIYGYDFVSGDSDPFDDNNHGTHVAGTIGAVGNNGIGTVGVCWNVSLMALKAFNERGNGTVADAIEAIHFAVDNGARVINASWGLGEKSRALEEAVQAAADAGVLFIAAAGNSRSDDLAYPAAYESVIAVAATDEKDGRAPFSNYGDWVDLAAPGLNILSTLPENRYGMESGTSMAAPHVAGVASLVLSRFPDYSRRELRDIMINSVDPIITDRRIGNGRMNAAMAVQMDEPLPSAEFTIEPGLSGTVQIRGNAFGRFFSSYVVNVRSGTASSGTNWTAIATGATSVTNGILAQFDSSIIPDGPVTVQLLVSNRNGYKAIATQESRILNTIITEPLSGELLPPGRHPVRGHVLGTMGFSLSYGKGLSPTSWVDIAAGAIGGLDQVLGTWDTTAMEDGLYTLRLISTNLTGVAEFKAPGIYLDSRLKSGFPLHLPAGIEFPISDWRQVRAADLDNDGMTEFVIVDPATRQLPQRLLVYSIAGDLLWSQILGYDIQPDVPAIGDVDGDGKLEIFVDGPEGVLAFNHQGQPFSSSWPIETETSNHAKVLADVDEDGELELITFSQEYITRQVQELRVLSVYKRDGSLLGQWEMPWCGFTNEVHKIYPAAANLDGKRGLEIVVPSACGQLAAYTLSETEPLWRASAEGTLLSSPVIGDVDGDGFLDVIVTAAPENGFRKGGVYIFNHEGRLWNGWPVLEDHAFHASPALGDLDQDGRLEIVLACRKEYELHVLQHDGFEAEGWPRRLFHLTTSRSGISLGDMDGDGAADIITSSPSLLSLALALNDSSYVQGVRAWRIDGEQIPLAANGGITSLHFDNMGGERWFKSAPPVLGDFDDNGKLDLLATSIQDRTHGTFTRITGRSSIYAWEGPNAPAGLRLEWPMFNQNVQNLGVYPFPLVPPPVPTNVTAAVRDRVICPEDGSLRIEPLKNDLAAVEGGLALISFTQPVSGIVSRDGDGALIYLPHPDYTGPDQFTYTIRDSAGTESSGTVLLRVKPINDPPIANDITVTVPRNGSVNIIYAAVDDEKEKLSYRIHTPPNHGELWNYPALGIYYPHAGFVGEDSFAYIANDGLHDSLPGRVTITVIDTNNPPTVSRQELVTKRNRPLVIQPAAKDLDNDPLTFEIASGPAHGTAEWVESKIHYTPGADYVGSDVISIRASDGYDWSKEGQIKIQVIATNAVPIASSTTEQVPPNVPTEVTLGGFDPDGDEVHFTVVTEPLHGALAGTAPSLTYTPRLDYRGPDRIEFTVSDGESESGIGTLTLQITRENLPPEANDIALSVPADYPFEVPLGLRDPDMDPIETVILKGPAKGIVYGSGTNMIYVPNPGAIGSDRFTFKGWDGQRFGNVATVSLTLNPPPDPSAAWLELLSASGHEIQLRLTIEKEVAIQLERSSNLIDWEPAFAPVTPLGGEYIFRDTNPPAGLRFYRAVTVD